MKKLLLATFILLAAFTSYAQKQETFIEVRGNAKIDREVESYRIDLTIAAEYAESEGRKDFEEIKKSFFAKAKAAGFEENRFKEDQMGYLALQYNRDGNLYSFETRSKEELLKVTKLANSGYGIVSIISTKLKYKPLKDRQKLLNAALLNSKETAATIGKSINKKIGEILMVSDYNDLELMSDDSYYRQSTDQYYSVAVRYAIE